jgi:hypothetical protein
LFKGFSGNALTGV